MQIPLLLTARVWFLIICSHTLFRVINWAAFGTRHKLKHSFFFFSIHQEESRQTFQSCLYAVLIREIKSCIFILCYADWSSGNFKQYLAPFRNIFSAPYLWWKHLALRLLNALLHSPAGGYLWAVWCWAGSIEHLREVFFFCFLQLSTIPVTSTVATTLKWYKMCNLRYQSIVIHIFSGSPCVLL